MSLVLVVISVTMLWCEMRTSKKSCSHIPTGIFHPIALDLIIIYIQSSSFFKIYRQKMSYSEKIGTNRRDY